MEKLQNLTNNDLTRALAAALIVHILFFSLATLHMPAIKTAGRTEVAFLGAILDSFAVEKISSERTMAPDVSRILKKTDPRAGRTITSPSKPNFAQQVNLHSKNFFKSTPDTGSPAKKLPAAPAQENRAAQEEPQPYERLRLYQ